jgi:hypothetical protein
MRLVNLKRYLRIFSTIAFVTLAVIAFQNFDVGQLNPLLCKNCKYSLKVENPNFSYDEMHQSFWYEFYYDLDNDGGRERVEIGINGNGGNFGVFSEKIDADNKAGRPYKNPYLYILPSNGYIWGGVSLVFFDDTLKFPSLLITRYQQSGYGFYPLPLILVQNTNGVFTTVTLPLTASGRDVDCTRVPNKQDPICFVAGYIDSGSNSSTTKLISFGPNGARLTDLMSSYGLAGAFTAVYNGSNDGVMARLGGRFIDYNRDGLPDLFVDSGHSELFSTTGKMVNGQYTLQPSTGEGFHSGTYSQYERLFAPHPWNVPAQFTPPCVYVGTQAFRGQSPLDDFVKCYDNVVNNWYVLNLGAAYSAHSYYPVSFWNKNDDGKIYFAARAKADNGAYTLFRLECTQNCTQGNFDGYFSDGTLQGFAFDYDRPGESIDVVLKIKTNGVTPSDEQSFTIKADQASDSANVPYGLKGKHRFIFQIPDKFKTGKVYVVSAFAQGREASPNQLPGSPRNITIPVQSSAKATGNFAVSNNKMSDKGAMSCGMVQSVSKNDPEPPTGMMMTFAFLLMPFAIALLMRNRLKFAHVVPVRIS